MKTFHRVLILVLCLACAHARAAALDAALAEQLNALAPRADPKVIDLALRAVSCAAQRKLGTVDRLTVIDYSKASTDPRLWVFDLERPSLLFEELVAHGRNSGENFAHEFSNEPDSKKSSIGLFRTDASYVGENGYSVRLDGLEPGFNDRARDRALVMHGAPYVSTAAVRALGRLGRSWGCPAVRLEIAEDLLDAVKDGRFVFVFYPDANWLATSTFLHCRADGQQQVRNAPAAANHVH